MGVRGLRRAPVFPKKELRQLRPHILECAVSASARRRRPGRVFSELFGGDSVHQSSVVHRPYRAEDWRPRPRSSGYTHGVIVHPATQS